MPSRRELLATAVATAPALAGCLGSNDPDGMASEFRDGHVSIPDDATVLARERTESSDGPGRVHETATVYERAAGGSTGLVLLTEYGVSPPAEGWEHAEFRAVHDWSVGEVEGSVRDHSTNTAPTDEPDPPLAVEDGSTTEQGRWRVHLTPPRTSPVTYRFETRVPSTELTAGDLVVETRTEAAFEEPGLFGDDATSEMGTALTYGETADG